MSAPVRLGAGEIGRLLAARDIHPSKSLGQNFVIDPNTVERIARLAKIGAGDRVLEIGAGLGSLTVALHATGAHVTALEIDHRLVASLNETVPKDVRVVQGDALTVNYDELLGDAAGEQPGSWSLVANLPYNVAAPVVLELLERVPRIGRMLVMVQREVGERLAATPGGKEYGAVSVRVAYFASAKIVGSVSPEVFHPRPRVESALVSIVRRPPPLLDGTPMRFAELDVLLRAGFLARRKMLRGSLAALVTPQDFVDAEIDPQVRAEELTLADWGKLAQCRRSITSSPTPS